MKYLPMLICALAVWACTEDGMTVDEDAGRSVVDAGSEPQADAISDVDLEPQADASTDSGQTASLPFELVELTENEFSLIHVIPGGIAVFSDATPSQSGEIVIYQNGEVHRFEHSTGVGRVIWSDEETGVFAIIVQEHLGVASNEIYTWNPDGSSLRLLASDVIPVPGGVHRGSSTRPTEITYFRMASLGFTLELDLAANETTVIPIAGVNRITLAPQTSEAIFYVYDPDATPSSYLIAYDPADDSRIDLGGAGGQQPLFVEGSRRFVLRNGAVTRVWDFDTKRATHYESQSGFGVQPLDEDNRYLAVYGSVGAPADLLRVYDLREDRLLFEAPNTRHSSAVISADSSTIAFKQGPMVVRYDIESGQRFDVMEASGDIEISANGRAFGATMPGRFRLSHVDHGMRDFDATNSGAPSDNGELWFVHDASYDGAGLFYHFPTDTRADMPGSADVAEYSSTRCRSVWSADGTRVIYATSGSTDNRVMMWSPSSGEQEILPDRSWKVIRPSTCKIDGISPDTEHGFVSVEFESGYRSRAWHGDAIFDLESDELLLQYADPDFRDVFYVAREAPRQLRKVDYSNRGSRIFSDDYLRHFQRAGPYYSWIALGSADGEETYRTYVRLYPVDESTEPFDLIDEVDDLFSFREYLFIWRNDVLHLAVPTVSDP